MSKKYMGTPSKYSFIFILFTIVSVHLVQCVELDVGGDKGWVTPSSKDGDQFFNDWASNNRFKVNDTLRFRYKKDSVLVVTQEEYERCRSSHPMFFSNNGDTIFTLDHSGLFYFISGVSGHCERGLQMIVKVLEPGSLPPPFANRTAAPPSPSAAAPLIRFHAHVSAIVPLAAFVMFALFFDSPILISS